MTTLHLTRGLPAAGKTTWAKKWVEEDPSNRARVNRDDLRAMLFVTPDYSWSQEKVVTEISRNAVKALSAEGRDVVADDTNLRPKYLREWIRFARANKMEVEIHEFPVDVEEALRRDRVREKRVGDEVILNMSKNFMRRGQFIPIQVEAEDAPVEDLYVPDGTLPPAIIVDIDGTVAIKHPERDIYDLSKVHMDLRNEAVVEAVQSADRDGYRIVFCSGRDAESRAVTELWLAENVAVPGELFMRAMGDRRRDSIVKRELFDNHIRDRYNVRYVLDDRKQVVDMWRSLGLTVMQVAEGDF